MRGLLLSFVCVFIAVIKCKEEKHVLKSKHIKVKKDEEHKENTKKPNDQNNDEDYDTTQGYPILYPETHMMSLKRNETMQPNRTMQTNATSNLSNPFDATTHNKTINEEGKCSKSVDLLFLLDSSESVKYSNWKIIIQFVKDLCNRFQLRSTKVGVIRYASEAEVALRLTEFNDTESRDAAIDDIFYKTGGTRTDIALKKAAEVLHVEDQRSQVVMLVTDGPTNRLEIDKNHFVEGKDLVAGPADRLKEAGVALFCIGVEPDSETPEEIDTMKEEMGVIASEPTKMHLFMSDGYRELERKVLLISNAACVVNGAWSAWSEYSPCSVTCGYGTKVRMRTCTNPSPENNGADCTGPRVEIEECDLGPCTAASTDGRFSSSSSTGGQIQIVSVRPTPSKTDKNNSADDKENSSDEKLSTSSNSTESNSAHQDATSPSTNATTTNTATNTTTKPPSTSNNETDSSGKPISVKWFINTTAPEHDDKNENHTGKTDQPHAQSDQPHAQSVGGCYEGLEEIKLNDNQYNSSSVYTHDTDDEYVKREYAPQNAKLNNQINGGGWCAEHKFAAGGDKNQYLQLDLGKKMAINAVATQGSHLLENWVRKYNLRYSDDGISWEYYNKNPLEGNNDRVSVQRNMLSPAVEARYVQLNPIEWNEQNEADKHDICMRAALYRCKNGAVATVKRGIIQPNSLDVNKETIKVARGIVLKEREWSHLPDQKTVFTLYSQRTKRQLVHTHHKGNKRIFKKLRKTAKNIMKNLNIKLRSG